MIPPKNKSINKKLFLKKLLKNRLTIFENEKLILILARDYFKNYGKLVKFYKDLDHLKK